jgi:2-dehydro-3-deoxyphosphogalactonate aldolase
MEIASVKTYIAGNPPPRRGCYPNFVFCKLMTDDGIEGWGECPAPYNREYALTKAIEEYGERFVLERDPFNIEAIWESLYKGEGGFIFQHPGSFHGQVVGSIEMACWDIIGKALKQPIYRLLGGVKNRQVRAYSYLVGWRRGDNPEKAGVAAANMVEQGITLFKFDPIPMRFRPRAVTLKELRYTDTALRSMRDAVGDDCDIAMGTHGQLNTHSAIRFAKILEKYDCLWFEEPVPLENVDEMARVAQHTTVPIATGERLHTKWEFRPLLEEQAAQILQISVGQNGILESKKIAVMAEAYNAQIAPWMYCGPVNCAANIQLDVCSPNFLAQEFNRLFITMTGEEAMDNIYSDFLEETFTIKDGYIIPSRKPGLGIGRVKEEFLNPPQKSRL